MTEPNPNAAHVDPPLTPTRAIMEHKIEKLKTPTKSSAQSLPSMNGPLYMQTINNKVIIRRVKRKDDGALKSLTRWFVDNQTGFSINIITLLFLTHFWMPKARPFTTKFFTLSYYNPETENYGLGGGDYYFVTFCIVLFTGLRACFMEHILGPLAKMWGISKRKDITRFSEQGWQLMYYSIFWTLGLYIYWKSDYWMNLKELWTNWPTRELSGLMKGYMLAQLAFWFQQVIVVNIEERRKDHWQMLTHHIITIALISTSYVYHQTRVGNLILVLMDFGDLILALAKCLKYLGFSTLCDVMFGIFMFSWASLRHVAYLMACWSVYKDLPVYTTYGCYSGKSANLTGPIPTPDGWTHLLEPFQNPEGLVCFNNNIKWGFLVSLLFLQVITIVWFCMIVKVAIRVIRGDGAEDTRSDDEDDVREQEEFEYEEAQPLEEEVGAEAIDFQGWERRTGVKRAASTSGVSLPGHSDRKELLNRIGCEKKVE